MVSPGPAPPSRTASVALLLVFSSVIFTDALLCLPCDQSKCEELPPGACRGSLAPGICGCCKVCARQRNETCGGVFGLYGTCDRGLRCVIRPPEDAEAVTQYEVGVCEDEDWEEGQWVGFEPCSENLVTGCNIQDGRCVCHALRSCSNLFQFPSLDSCQTDLTLIEESRPDCSTARCEVQFSPLCPEDSVLIEGYAPAGQCCPLPSRCVCRPAGCLRKLCPPAHLTILVTKATGRPGQCCDLTQCKPAYSVDCSSVECPPDHQGSCPPDSFETQVRLTADGCCTLPSRCECVPGGCVIPSCPLGSAPQLVAPGNGTPGRCCDQYECVNDTRSVCVFGGAEHSEGQLFRLDSCRFCRCQGGVANCYHAQCGALRCQRQYTPPGECCAVCEDPLYPALGVAGCYVNGRIIAHGDHWREDDCTFCQCVSGERRCVAAACSHNCLNPVKVPGECCPVCQEPSYITVAPPTSCPQDSCFLSERDCRYGYHTDPNGCRICRCRTREEHCLLLASGCNVKCPQGRQTDSDGCETCRCRTKRCRSLELWCDKPCPLGYIKNRHGCDTCRCRKCPEVPCDLSCPMGFQTDQLGCLQCLCRDRPITSPEVPSNRKGTCLSMDGHRHSDGESWHDGCRDCYCHGDREMCSLISCPVPRCEDPSIQPGHCCPTCPELPGAPPPPALEAAGDSSVCVSPSREVFSGGEVWNMDACSQCTCRRGQTLCESEVCPPLLCDQPVRTQDSCCPHCPEVSSMAPPPLSNSSSLVGGGEQGSVCHGEGGGAVGGAVGGDIFLPGESWKPDVCTSCVCVAGTIHCFTESCPASSCPRPLLRKGQCCPYCLDGPSLPDVAAAPPVCHFNGRQYSDEERWDIDACTHCYCLAGETLCSTLSCPRSPPCAHSTPTVTKEGSCCPTCPEMYSPTNVPIEKTDQTIDGKQAPPAWDHPSHSPNDLPPHRGLRMPFLTGSSSPGAESGSSEEEGEQGLAAAAAVWAVLPLLLLLLLLLLSALLYTSHRRRWRPRPQKGASSSLSRQQQQQQQTPPRVLRIAEPEPRFSGYYSMKNPPVSNHLTHDAFYSTH